MGKEKVLKRWNEYIERLFHNNIGEKSTIYKSRKRSVILNSEVRLALCKKKKNKAIKPDMIVKEILTALGNLGIDKITKMINKIYNSGEILEEHRKSISMHC